MTKVPQALAVLLSFALLASCDRVEEEVSFSSVVDEEAEADSASDLSSIPVVGSEGDRPMVFLIQTDLAEPFRKVQSLLFADQIILDQRVAAEIMDPRGISEDQLALFNAALDRKPAAIAIVPIDVEGLSVGFTKAAEQGVPVVVVGAPPEAAPYAASLRADDREVGRLAAEFVVQRLKIKMRAEGNEEVYATLFEFTGTDLEDDVSRQRSEGFHNELAKHPGIQLLHQAPGGWNEVDGARRMVEALEIHGTADVVFSHNDAIAHGAFLAARKLGKHSQTLFLGVDGVGGDKGGIRLVRDQMLAGSVSTPLLGTEIAELLADLAEGKTPSQRDTVVPAEMVTIANAIPMFDKHTNLGAAVERGTTTEE